MIERDFKGYANKPPDIRWPNGGRFAVSFVLNVEEGAELNIGDGDERNEARHEVRQEVLGAADLCTASHYEYSTRVAYWRVMNEFERAGVPLTFNVCTRALERAPWIAEDGVRRGVEFMCHGYRWETHHGMTPDHELAVIRRATEGIRRLTGQRPLGWHTRSSPSVNTRRLIAGEGFLYDSDAYNDDLPYYVTVAGKAHLVLPYCFDTNDMRFHDSYAFVHGRDFADYTIAAFDWLHAESQHAPKMLSIGLHIRIIGRAGRIAGLRTLLDHLKHAPGVWLTQRRDIARHWLNAVPPA
ncbi:MAG: polysaccharide deacetylase family protein [Proteobacteria bacterium]|nr:polysaccharide deacetylase family protein [Burkholderiales bacterium]